MIKAIVFDLDGTLVQSEKLKAQSYAIAVQRLRGLREPDPQAIEAICASDDEMVQEIRDTVVHEVAHHFGIDDDRLEEMER